MGIVGHRGATHAAIKNMTVAIVGQGQFVCHTLARTVLGKENDVPVAGPNL